MTKEKQEKTELEKAQEVLAKAETEKRQKCASEIQVVLDKYGYKLQVSQPNILLANK